MIEDLTSYPPYPPSVSTSSPPNAHQIEVAAACDSTSYADAGRRFGITGHRAKMIKDRVDAYRKWLTDCAEEAAIARDNRRVDFVDLSTRTRNALKRGGVITVGQMMALSANEIMDMEGAGKAAAAEVQAYLGASE